MTRSQAIWLLTALAGVALLVALEVASWPLLHTACHSVCHSGQPNVTTAHTLHSLGISLHTFAIFSVARDVLLRFIWFGVGGLIILHRPRDRGPVIAAFFLVLFTVNAENAVVVPANLQGVETFTGFMAGSVLVVFGLLFPDGRFVPRWMRWVALISILEIAATTFLPPSLVNTSTWPALIQLLSLAIPLFSILGAQVYRYRRVSSWEQRQQMKWVLFGLGILLLGLLTLGMGYRLVPDANTPGSLYDVAAYTDYPLCTTALPVSIGIAMLRSRLWDVDHVINRTLVYGLLTLTLGLFYIASVIALQGLMQSLTGRPSDLTVAIATLAVAALFNPWRHRLQAFIDRRFYRRRYDAGRILAAFNARLRDEVDLDRLSSDILATVTDTIEPERVSLWLPESTTR